LPGVGTAKQAMRQLQTYQLLAVIPELKQPVLGICLGMQLLYEFSQEGDVPCLGIISGVINLLQARPDLPSPHMGWNRLTRVGNTDSVLLNNIAENSHLYYVHSYAAPITGDTIATTTYGESFCAVVQRN